jgi:hypothetical protein
LTDGLVVGRESPTPEIEAALAPRYADVSRRHQEIQVSAGHVTVVSRSHRSETHLVTPAAPDQRLKPDLEYPLPDDTPTTLRLGDHCHIRVDP